VRGLMGGEVGVGSVDFVEVWELFSIGSFDMLQCPVCDHGLVERTIGGTTVDVCEDGCGGIWFDRFELQQFDDVEEVAGEVLVDLLPTGDGTVRRDEACCCPRCEGQVMMRHFFDVTKRVEVDECPACGGFWLDGGELQAIRELFNSQEERKEMEEQFVGKLSCEKLNAAENPDEAGLVRAGRVAGLLRFLLPSSLFMNR